MCVFCVHTYTDIMNNKNQLIVIAFCVNSIILVSVNFIAFDNRLFITCFIRFMSP